MAKSYDVLGYTFLADIFCPECLPKVMGASEKDNVAQVEDFLDQEAARLGIDRYDETTFDSGEFPKVIFADQVVYLTCGACGEEL